MVRTKTAIVTSALFFIIIAPIQAQLATLPGAAPTTGGLRIQLDENGNRVQPGTKGTPSAAPVSTPGTGAAPTPSADGLDTGHTRAGVAAPAPVGPQVVSSTEGAGTVVRLNGLFRAGSRASIGADGKLQGECHVESGEKRQ